VPCWPLSESKVSGAPSVLVRETWCLKYSIERLERQNKRFASILIITEWKNAHFFVGKPTGFVHEELRDFVKMTLTRVSSHLLWLDSSHSVKNVTRVESPFFSAWLESSPSHSTSWLESLTRVTLHCNADLVSADKIHHHHDKTRSAKLSTWICYGPQ